MVHIRPLTHTGCLPINHHTFGIFWTCLVLASSSWRIYYKNIWLTLCMLGNFHRRSYHAHKSAFMYNFEPQNEPWHEISNNVVCATSKGSDQPGRTSSLIRVFASRLNILWIKPLTEHHLDRVSKLKMGLHRLFWQIPHCWKSHVTAQIWDSSIPVLKVSWWYRQILIQNECGKAILKCLLLILVGVIYEGVIFSKTPFRGLAPIYYVKWVLIHIRLNIVHRYQDCA